MYDITIQLANPAVGPYKLADGAEWNSGNIWYACYVAESTEPVWSVHAWDETDRVFVYAADEASARAIYANVANHYFHGYAAEYDKRPVAAVKIEGTAALCYGVPTEVLDRASMVEQKYIACTVYPDGTGTVTCA